MPAGSGVTRCIAAALALAAADIAQAQTPAAPSTPPAPAAAIPSTSSAQPVAAKSLFGAAKVPAPLKPQSIGEYARGCLAGARAIPVDGPAWQVMRLSRNRNWGHPALVEWLETFAKNAKAHDGWSGLMVGDLAQPRGGPMLTGHASHQIGLDADLWFTPMPDRRLTPQEREEISAVSMLGPDKLSVDPAVWTESRLRILKRAASTPEVERIFVHPAIKKQVCQDAAKLGPDRTWLAKIRPWWDHHYHFHVRIGCPKDSGQCSPQKPIPADDGCGKELDDWFKLLTAPPKPPVEPKTPPPPPMTIDKLPAECRVVLEAGPGGVSAGPKPRPVPASMSPMPSGTQVFQQ